MNKIYQNRNINQFRKMGLRALLILVFSGTASADLDSFKFEAQVKSYDEKKVVVDIKGQQFAFPRHTIQSQQFRQGQKVVVQLAGTDMKYLTPPQAAKAPSRSPAGGNSSSAPQSGRRAPTAPNASR
jgi:hypothetical protein